MADIQSNININVDTTNATAAIRNLQSQISAFHQQMQKSGSAANAATSASMQRNLINSINATKKFGATMATISTETESFTNALEKNKLSMGQYFRYAGASTKTFGRLFRSEFDTISKVAESRVRTLQTQYIKMGRDASGAMKAIQVRPLSLDMQNLSTQTMMAAQKQQIFNQLLKQGSTNLLNFGKNTQWAGRQLMVGFTVPLSILGTMAVKEFQKIEEQVIRLKRVYGDMFTTDAEVDKAVKSVRDLADEFTKYGIAVESTIGLAASVAQMGNVGADMINQVTEATKLAVLGGMEQEKALDTTISLTNAFGIATADLTQKINFLNAAENQTILAIDDFTEAVPKAGSVVAQLGGSVEDLAFFLTAMREGGVNASQAANALKSSLARLVNPTKQAQDDLNKLGIDILGIVESNVGDLKGTIFDLGDALDELKPLDRSRALEELFGKFQFARMSTLFNNIKREGSQAQEILKLTRNSAAELQVLADRELARVEESPATKLQKQIEKLQAALAPIGAEFAKLITPLVEFVTGLLKKFNEMGDGAKSFVTGLVTVLGLIAPAAIMSFGLIANGVANVMKAFNAYRSFLQILSGSNRDVTTTTQYMTQEQLEAASVATNLGQAHQYLAQQFTVESSALQQLTDVYRAANAEMAKYNASSSIAATTPARPIVPPIRRVPGSRRAQSPGGPIQYANGTLSVPGPKGAGDIVPALLSPGEAVIPARQSERYSGFIQSIMNDEVPGMFFGGIAGMLGRSRVATRMSSSTFMGSLKSGDLSYKSGFATGTGADFTDRMGRPMKQHQLMRRQAENKLYGVPVGKDDPSMRPTYGSVAMSPLQRILSIIFGGRKGRQFASVTNPMASNLDQYGDISLIGKRSMNRRASTFVGDTLLKYSKNPAWVRGTAPMRGASAEQMKTAGYGAFDSPFGAVRDARGGITQNTAPSYIEAQTMGGFKYNEIDRIITRDPAMKKRLRAELRAAGLGGIRVGGPGFISGLLSKLGIPGFEDGIFSVPGPKGAGDIFPAMLAPGEAVIPAKKAKKYRGFIKAMIADNIPGFDGGDFSVGKESMTGGQSMLYSGLGMYAPGNNAQGFGMDRDFFTSGEEFGQSLTASAVGGALGLDKRPATAKNVEEYHSAIAKYMPEIVKILRETYEDMLAAGESVDSIEQVVDRAEGKLRKQFGTMRKAGGPAASSADALERHMFFPTEEEMGGQYGEVRAPSAKRNRRGQLGVSMFRKRRSPFQNKIRGVFKKLTGKAPSKKETYAHMNEQRMLGPMLPMTGTATQLPPAERAAYEKIIDKKSADIQSRYPATGMFSRKLINEAAIPSGAQTITARQVRRVSRPSSVTAPSAPRPLPKQFSFPQAVTDPFSQSEVKARTKRSVSTFANKFGQRFVAAGTAIGKQAATAITKSKSIAKGISSRVASSVGTAVTAMQARMTRSGQVSDEVAMGPDGNPIVDKKGNPVSVKDAERQTRRMASRQKRGMIAGRLGGAMGSASMMLGMTSMMPGIGDNPVMKAVQGFMPALFGLSAVLPMLAALPAPLAALIAVVGAGVAAFVMFNNHMNKVGEEARKTAEVMGVGTKAMEKFAEASGNVTATQARDIERAGAFQPFSIAAGKNTFGAQFIESEQGKELVDEIQKAGLSDSQDVLFSQLSSAVASGALDVTQARKVAYAIGEQLDDQNVGMNVNARLTQMFGPNGENLLEDPLQIQLAIMRQTGSSLDEDFNNLQETIDGLNFENFDKKARESADTFYEDTIKSATGIELPGWFTDVQNALEFLNPINLLGKAITGDEKFDVLSAVGGSLTAGVEQAEMSTKAIEAYSVKTVNALQSYQSAVDALDVNYDKQIEAARAAGDEEKARELILQKERERNILMEEYGNASQQIVDNFINADTEVQSKLLDAANAALDRKFEDDKESAILFEAAAERFEESLPESQQYELKMLLAGDALTLNSFDWISQNLEGASVSKLLNLRTKVTGKELNTVTSLLQQFGEDGQQEFLTKLTIQSNAEEARENIEIFSQINQLADTLGADNAQELMDFYIDPDNVFELMQLKKGIEDIKAFDGEKLTVEYIQSIQGEEDFANIIKANQEYFDGLDKNQQVVYTQIVQTLALADPNQLRKDALASAISEGTFGRMNPFGPGGLDESLEQKIIADYINKIAEQRTELLELLNMGEGDGASGTGGGSGPVASSLDQILNKLRDVRDETVQLKNTWVDSFEEINRVVGEGIDKFEGVSQQLRSLGANQPLINYILGMSPEEYEKRKDELLDFSDNKIVGLKEGAENVAVALNAIKLGEFQDKQQASLEAINAQNTAITKLIASGYSLEDAYKLVSDETLAYAIAAEGNVDVINELVEATERATKATEDFAFAQKISGEMSSAAARDSVVDWISENLPQLNQEMFNAIISDEYISGLLDTLQGGGLLSQEEFDNIENFFNNLTASGEVDLKIADIEFLQSPLDQFKDGMSAVREKFSAMETQVELKYKGLNRADNNIIEQAENDIAALNFELDDLNASMEEIDDQETAINEKYDERFEALDKVKEVNKAIADQQKSQLDIADALSRGDIAAAAKAVQSARAKQQEQRFENMRAAMEKRKEQEISEIRTSNGQRREDIENRIKEITDEIKTIEEERLEPAQERIRLQDILMKKEMEAITVLGQTQEEWNRIQNGVDLATTKTDQFIARLEAARDVANAIASGSMTPEQLTTTPTPSFNVEDVIGSDQVESDQAQKEISDKDKTIAELNRRIAITRYRVKGSEEDLTAEQESNLMALNVKRIKEIRKLGGVPDMTGMIKPGTTSKITDLAAGFAMGGKVSYFPMGGLIPYKAVGGMFKSLGSDTVPAMLTPGEFVIKRPAVREFGVDNLEKINNTGQLNDGSVYNYSVNVNVKSDANPDEIARTVMSEIKRVDSQRLRGNKL